MVKIHLEEKAPDIKKYHEKKNLAHRRVTKIRKALEKQIDVSMVRANTKRTNTFQHIVC
jgi:Zn-dependent oligopeptidase